MHRRAIAMAAASATAVGMLATMAPATAAPSDGERKPYVVLMADMPALGYEGGVKGIPSTKPAKGEKINPKAGNVKAYVSHLEKQHRSVLDTAGVQAEPVNELTYAANGFAVQLTDAEAETLRLSKGVVAVMEDVLKQKQTDVSPQFLGLSTAGGAWMQGATGKGVVVGVIDSGIWPEHPSFADNGLPRPTGIATDIPCEFGGSGGTLEDPAFECQDKLLGARDMRTVYNAEQGPEQYDSARDADGHGTHTASTAAGNRDVDAEIFGIDRGTVSGIAPDASIIAYKGLGDLGGYGSDLADAIDQAVADGVDVINYSIGSSSAAIGPDDVAFLFAANAGIFVATSAGNAGPGPQSVGSPGTVPWLTTVGASTHNRTFENTITLGNGATYVGTSITEGVGMTKLIDAADRGNPLCLTDEDFTPALAGEIVLCERGENARVDKSKAVADGGGAGMILFNQNDEQALITDSHWVPSSHIRRTPGLEIKAYIDSAGDAATASLTQGQQTETQANVMADFSSRGPLPAPASPDLIKPDITAPGVNILAGNTPTPNSGRTGQLFQSISGTSMSSPHVAGLFALLKQVHPDWSASAAKSAIMTTARQDVVKEDGTTPADPFDFGAGHVDPGTVGERGSMFDPGFAFEADILDYAAFACGALAGQVFGSSTCDSLEAAGYSFDGTQLNVPSVGISQVAGSHTVTRTLSNVSTSALRLEAHVDAPEGYAVTVSPATITVPAKKSTTVQITVTNTSGPVDEWKFGAITWRTTPEQRVKGYEGRIPVAVKAAALKSPAEVSTTGESGTGSVDVTFGYTGDYSVNAFGLADQVDTAGTVSQDPNASFSPADVANGGATRHDISVPSGTKLWRIVLNDSDLNRPGEDVDLDLYLYSLSSGTLVASSGSGGTTELIELADPAAGDYALFVHGWGTAGGPVEYNVRSWQVTPPADGGTLQVESAPASATIGETGTIEYSWTGVDAGTTELGLLVHSDAEGEIGTTVVSVSAP